jgi:hypothetical protein
MWTYLAARFAARRSGCEASYPDLMAIVFFGVVGADIALVEIFARPVTLLIGVSFLFLGGFCRIGLGFRRGSKDNSRVCNHALARFLSRAG